MRLILKQLASSLLAAIIISSAYAQYPPVFKNSAYGHNPKYGHYATIRGFKMYYEIYGQGKPLLFIHGNGGEINNFSGQIPYFVQKHYQVIAVDSRAQGKSTDASDSLNYTIMAEDYNTLLDTLHIKGCNLIGWSDGGIIGLLLAIHHPDKIEKLAVTGANLWNDSTAIAPDMPGIPVQILDSLSKLPQTAEVKNEIKVWNLVYKEPGITLAQLHSIQCATLVIGGDNDLILPKHTLLIAENIPKSYLWIVPNSGHSTLINYKDQFNQTVELFFRRPYRVIKGIDRLN